MSLRMAEPLPMRGPGCGKTGRCDEESSSLRRLPAAAWGIAAVAVHASRWAQTVMIIMPPSGGLYSRVGGNFLGAPESRREEPDWG